MKRFLVSPRNFALNKSGYTNDEDIRLVCCGEQANGTGFEGPEHLVSLDASKDLETS